MESQNLFDYLNAVSIIVSFALSPVMFGLAKKLYTIDVRARKALEQIEENTRTLVEFKETAGLTTKSLSFLDKKLKDCSKTVVVNSRRLSKLEEGSQFGITEYKKEINELSLTAGINHAKLLQLEEWAKENHNYKPPVIKKEFF